VGMYVAGIFQGGAECSPGFCRIYPTRSGHWCSSRSDMSLRHSFLRFPRLRHVLFGIYIGSSCPIGRLMQRRVGAVYLPGLNAHLQSLFGRPSCIKCSRLFKPPRHNGIRLCALAIWPRRVVLPSLLCAASSSVRPGDCV
jgi:hypothetical protein